MRPIRIVIERFRSFHGRQEFIFPRTPGLYYLTGRNEAQPELGANGVGKSTLWDAVTWCLYGRTVRGLGAGDVSSWGSSKPGGVLVQLEIEVRSRRITIRRTWKPNTLQLITDRGPSPIDQKELEKILGMNLLSFLNSVMFGQFSQTFLDLDPSKKEHVLCSALGLNVWLDYSKAAGSKASELARKERENHGDIRNLEGSLQVLQEEDYHNNYNGQEQWLIEDIKRARKDIKEAEATLDTLSDELEGFTEDLESLQDLEEQEQDSAALYREAKDTLYTSWQKAQLLLSQEEKALKALESQQGSRCSVCGQPLTRQHRQEEVLKRSIRVQNLWDKASEEENKYRTAEKELAAATQKLNKAAREVDSVSDEIKKIEKQYDTIEDKIANYRATIKRSRKELSKVRKDREEELQARTRKTSNTRRNLSNAKVLGHKLREDLHYAKYWVSGFRDVRLFLMEDALKQLERSVNAAMASLGLGGWKLEFTTKKVTKKGEVTGSRLDAFVTAPDTQDKVPWEAWSGGESQRLRLAGAMGLSELIAISTGNRLGIEVWDEPTSWLSKEGVDNLVQLLRERAIRERKIIWLVDHRTLGATFDGTWSVVKTRSGSKIEKIGGSGGET